MTALNKVFIRAYGKSAKAERRADTVAAASPAGQRIDAAHAPAVPPPQQPPAQESAPTPATWFQPPDEGRIDARHQTPPPHWSLPEIAGRGSPDLALPSTEGLPLREGPGEVANPLGAFGRPAVDDFGGVERPAPSAVEALSAVEAPSAAEPQSATQPTRAAFEVDRFLWPEACQRMLSAANWSEASRQLSAASREGQQVFVITSQHRGEGRTLLALCLAQRLAEKQLRVTLIDADFRGPQLARQLKLLPACTWDDVLRGPLPLTESWIESVEDGVTLLPLKERADTTGLTGNPRLKELLSLLRRTSDIVLIDAGSLEDFSDREVLALLGGTAQIDGALIVRDVRKTAVEELEQAEASLDALGIGRVDVVENFVK
jgi:Mrp family chromosome partitioning ATPase